MQQMDKLLLTNCNDNHPSVVCVPKLSNIQLSSPAVPRANIKETWNFSFLIYAHSVGLRGRGISPMQVRYLRRTAQTQNKRRKIYMP
jgi:hypothetical protein